MIKKKLNKLIGEKKTLLGIGPMSLNCINASINLSVFYETPLMLIASRRQIDSEDHGNGYVCNWSTNEYANYINNTNNKNIILCRDHGGPWQNNIEIEKNYNLELAMQSAKNSFAKDIDNDFRILHIDPSIDIHKKISLEETLERLKDLYLFCCEYAKKNNKKIEIEIGTEEQSGEIDNLEDLEYSLSEIKKFCFTNKLITPLFVVVQTGTKVMETKNIGVFEKNCFDKNRKIMGKINNLCSKYNILIKQHNTDYLTNKSLSEIPRLNIHSVNVAPEFAIAESKKLFEIIDNYSLTKIKDRIIELCINSNKWKKWVIKENDISDYEKSILCCHYIYSKKEFISIKEEIATESKMTIADLNSILRKEIESVIFNYMSHFKLV